MRLRQIVLAVKDIDRIERAFAELFGWRVAYRDPIVGKWGLRNSVIPVGDEFIEIVSPTREDTSAGRHMARIGGDGGYMVMFQVADQAAEAQRLTAAGVRAVYRSDQETYCLTQFHPGDCGGLIMAMEQVLHPAGADWTASNGYWHAAGGETWRTDIITTRVGSIRRVVLGGASAAKLAHTYAGLLDRPIAINGADLVIELPGPDVAFVENAGTGAMVRLDLEAHDRNAVLAAATSRGLPVDGDEVTLGGVGFRLV